MTSPNDMTNREAGPMLDPDERPAGTDKRWAILIGFAAVVLLVASSINHQSDKPDQPPAAAAATQPAPASTNAVLPQGAPATKSGG
jgi:hypothetical protein